MTEDPFDSASPPLSANERAQLTASAQPPTRDLSFDDEAERNLAPVPPERVRPEDRNKSLDLIESELESLYAHPGWRSSWHQAHDRIHRRIFELTDAKLVLQAQQQNRQSSYVIPPGPSLDRPPTTQAPPMPTRLEIGALWPVGADAATVDRDMQTLEAAAERMGVGESLPLVLQAANYARAHPQSDDEVLADLVEEYGPDEAGMMLDDIKSLYDAAPPELQAGLDQYVSTKLAKALCFAWRSRRL